MIKKLYSSLLIVSCCLIYINANSQAYYKKYLRDSIYNHDDREFIETDDGGYIFCGNESQLFTTLGGGLYKTTSDGHLIWHKSYRWSGGNPFFRSIVSIDSGNFIVTAVFDSQGKYGFIKFDSLGNILSKIVLEGIKAPNHAYARGEIMRSDDGLIIFGDDSALTHPVVVRTDFDGNVLWSRKLTIGVCNEDIAGMDADSMGNIYINCDDRNSICSTDSITKLIKLDSAGNLVWAKTFNYGFDTRAIRCVTANRIIIAGKRPGLPRPLAFEVDSAGNIIYSKEYSGISGQSVEICFDNNADANVFVIRIYGSLAYDHQDVMVTNANGSIASVNSYDDSVYTSFSNFIRKTSDGWVLAGGEIIKFDSAFNSLCPVTSYTLNETSFTMSEHILSVTLDTLNIQKIPAAYPITISSTPYQEFELCITTGVFDRMQQALSIFPNPFQETIYLELPEEGKNIHFELFDITGKKLLESYFEHREKININIPGLAPGCYIIRVIADDLVYSKIILKK